MLTFRKESFLRTLQKEGHLDDFFSRCSRKRTWIEPQLVWPFYPTLV